MYSNDREREVWREIHEHPNYMVSNLGRVKSKSRYLINRNGIKRFWKERIITSHLGGSGYFCIVLDGKNHWTHKLVARAFIENPDDKLCINHKDRNKRNNAAINLEWVTHSENMDRLMESLDGGERLGTMRLTKDQKGRIIERIRNGESDDRLSVEYEVCEETIRRVRRSVGMYRRSGARGERNGMSKLTVEKAKRVRKLFDCGVSCRLIASEVGVSLSAIKDVVKGRTWG